MNVDKAEDIASEIEVPVVYQNGRYTLASEEAFDALGDEGVIEPEHMEAAFEVLRDRVRSYNEQW